MIKYEYIIAESETVFGTITRRYKTKEDAKTDKTFLYDRLYGYYYDEFGKLQRKEITNND